MLDIQKKYREKRGRAVRVFSSARSNVAQDTVAGCSTSADSAVHAHSSASSNSDSLRRKDLDALLLMAKQNVDIVDEDMGEMAERLQVYLARNNGTEEFERPFEGSWRDV